MTAIGVFRDDYYNAISVLPQAQYNATTQATGTVLSAAVMAGAGDCYVNFSGQAGALAITTDSAVNIIAQLQQAVAAAYKAQIASFGAGVQPPVGVPNLFNLAYTLTVVNNNTASGAITFTGGAGVTITSPAGGAAGNVVAIASQREYLVTVTSPTSVSVQELFGGAIA